MTCSQGCANPDRLGRPGPDTVVQPRPERPGPQGQEWEVGSAGREDPVRFARVRRSVAISFLAVVALGASGCTQKDDTQSNLPRPSRAFCAAAAHYDAAVSSKKVSLTQHVRFTYAIAKTAPADARRDAAVVWHSFEKLRAGDRSVIDNPRVKAAIEHVNRRAGQDCGWYRRKEGL